MSTQLKRPADSYSPLYFLASLGAGGLSVTFFMFLFFWVPHKGRPVPIFEDVVAAFNAGLGQVHGDMDETIDYLGVTAAYPSAEAMVDRWAARAGCTEEVTAGEALDLDQTIPGAETTVEDHVTGCSGADASLWTIAGGSHIPDLTSGPFAADLLEWLDRHRR